ANELRYQQQADKNDCEPLCHFERDLHTLLARRLRISQTEITAAAKINGTMITANLRFPFTITRVVMVPSGEILRIRGLPSRSRERSYEYEDCQADLRASKPQARYS